MDAAATLGSGFVNEIFSISWKTWSLSTFVICACACMCRSTLYLIWHTLGRDMRAAYRYLRILLLVFIYKKTNMTVDRVFSKTVAQMKHKTCILYEDQVWTFLELEQYSNRVANYLHNAGFRSGDCIALFMENRPEYIGIWLGCVKLGICPALINSNLVGDPFLHSIKSVSASACIYGYEFEHVISNIVESLLGVQLFRFGGDDFVHPKSDFSFTPIDDDIASMSSEFSPKTARNLEPNFNDKMLYIYTSGTTGLPKAAIIKHSRFFNYSTAMYYMTAMNWISDIVHYNPLPLYHSAGGVVGIGLMMVFGITVVIRKKFSVTKYWKDCVRYNCNSAQYIGEICRYLLSVPECPEEKNHRIKLMFGNGLRPLIWNEFTDRFGIRNICEFYGATEGNTSLLNIDSVPGAVGFISMLFPSIYPVRLIRVSQTGEVLRDSSNRCILCKPGEPGEFIGKIIANHISRDFDGYVDKEATDKKILKDVLSKGDTWFRSGDILVTDEFGWLYFLDRLGDTYRWKGENISTMEVEAALSGLLKQQDIIVYGVKVPGIEGRAGMAVIVEPQGGLDLNWFLQEIKQKLPSYSLPIFVRLVNEVDVTGTFKLKKMVLQKEGFNPNLISDTMFFYDKAAGVYRLLDSCLYNDIIRMRCRV